MNYLSFLIAQRRFLAFGFALTLFSAFGQTYYIGIFSAEIRGAFSLTHGGFGLTYSLATLTSAACLIWAGRMIDHLDLRHYTALVCGGLALATLIMGFVPHIAVLYLVIFALRFFGQGLMTHTAITSMARYYDKDRGKAISVATFGNPLGQGIFGFIAVYAIARMGWRETWLATGGALVLLLIPLALWLLKGHPERHRRYLEGQRQTPPAPGEEKSAPPARAWTRRDVVRDLRFYLILPSMMAPSFISTGFFFHGAHLAQSKGWALAYLAGTFMVYSVTTVAAALFSGPLIDRIGARRLLPLFLLPMAVSMLSIALSDHPNIAFIYMFAFGLSMGMNFTIGGAVWAEIYGTGHIGAIRALAASCTVFATALSPVMMGFFIDRGVRLETMALLCAAFIAAAALIVVPLARGEGVAGASPR
ncbi:MAG: MFS transporter [bacterium]|nr:MFS transporter [bacterium]